MSLSVDTEAETQDFTIRKEQFMLPERLIHPSCQPGSCTIANQNVCGMSVLFIKSYFHRHLMLSSQLNQQPSINLTLSSTF